MPNLRKKGLVELAFYKTRTGHDDNDVEKVHLLLVPFVHNSTWPFGTFRNSEYKSFVFLLNIISFLLEIYFIS